MNTILASLLIWAQVIFAYYVHDRFEKQHALVAGLYTPCKGIE